MSDSQTLRSVLREPEASRTLAVASVSASESLPAGREAESQVDRPRANSNSFVEGMARELARGSARLGADDSEVREAFSAPSRRRSREARPASRPKSGSRLRDRYGSISRLLTPSSLTDVWPSTEMATGPGFKQRKRDYLLDGKVALSRKPNLFGQRNASRGRRTKATCGRAHREDRCLIVRR